MSARRPVRIGAVSYLNTRPLVHGLLEGSAGGDAAGGSPAPPLDLRYDVPSALARRLASGELDVALLPCVELARIAGLTPVPGLGIASRGDVRSVHLVARRPLHEIRSIALDPDSRTSNALVRVLCAEHWGVAPRFVEGGGPLETILRKCDAALRIGDKALFEALPAGAALTDLAGEWSRWTGLPFVFAVWAARPQAAGAHLVDLLHASYRAGRGALERIAREHAARHGVSADLLRTYLTECIHYELGEEELRGMRRFFASAARLGLIERVPPVPPAAVPPRPAPLAGPGGAGR